MIFSGVWAATSSISMPPSVLAIKIGQPGIPIDEDAEIQFFGDGGAFFDQQATHLSSFRTGLVRDEGFPDQFLDQAWHCRLVLGNLDPAGLSATACMDLRFHDKDRGIEFCCPCRSAASGSFDLFPRGTGIPNCREQLLRLKLMNIHRNL